MFQNRRIMMQKVSFNEITHGFTFGVVSVAAPGTVGKITKYPCEMVE
jgi:hypothetical protein